MMTVHDELLREKLEIALDGKGASRRFKNVLSAIRASRPFTSYQWEDHGEESSPTLDRGPERVRRAALSFQLESNGASEYGFHPDAIPHYSSFRLTETI